MKYKYLLLRPRSFMETDMETGPCGCGAGCGCSGAAIMFVTDTATRRFTTDGGGGAEEEEEEEGV
jgi:hypothetical protein